MDTLYKLEVAMPMLNFSESSSSFLSSDFPRNPPRLCLTAESDEFDEQTLQDWQAEGFDASYLPMGKGGEKYRESLDSLSRGLTVGQSYAIIGK